MSDTRSGLALEAIQTQVELGYLARLYACDKINEWNYQEERKKLLEKLVENNDLLSFLDNVMRAKTLSEVGR